MSKMEFVKRLESEKRMDEKDGMTRAKVQEHNDVLRWPTSLQDDCVRTRFMGGCALSDTCETSSRRQWTGMMASREYEETKKRTSVFLAAESGRRMARKTRRRRSGEYAGSKQVECCSVSARRGPGGRRGGVGDARHGGQANIVDTPLRRWTWHGKRQAEKCEAYGGCSRANVR